MRIIIAGAGKLGFSIAQLLAEDQFDVVVVEIDPKRKEVVQNSLDVLAIPAVQLFLQIRMCVTRMLSLLVPTVTRLIW